MDLWQFLGSIAGAAFAIFLFLTTTNKGRLLVFGTLVLFVVADLFCRYKLDEGIAEWVPRRVRYCQNSDRFFSCFFSWDYENAKRRELEQLPNASVCNLCQTRERLVPVDRIRYVRIDENNIARADIARLLTFIDMPFSEARYTLGQAAGLEDISSAGEQGGTATTQGQFDIYTVPIRVDNIMPQLVNFRDGCASNAQLTLAVGNGRIAEIDWIGTVDKRCFDLYWQPALGRLYDFRIDEQYRSRRVIDTMIYSYDDSGRKILIVTSRSPVPERRSVGVRIAIISNRQVVLPWPLPEWNYLAFYRLTENIAQQ